MFAPTQADAPPANMDRELIIFDAEESVSAAMPVAAAAGGDYADDDEDEASLMARILAAHGPNAMATDQFSSSSSSSSSVSTRKRPQSAFSASSSSVLPGAREDSSGVGDAALLRDALASAQQRANLANMPKSMRAEVLSQMAPKYSKTLVRIQCPGDRVLQCAFHPRETVRTMFAWLGTLLTPQAAAALTLQAPPAMRLTGASAELDKTFAALGLVPAAKLQLKCTSVVDGEIFLPATLAAHLRDRALLASGAVTQMPTRIADGGSVPLPPDLAQLVSAWQSQPHAPQPRQSAASDAMDEETAIQMEIERRMGLIGGGGGSGAGARGGGGAGGGKLPSWFKK